MKYSHHNAGGALKNIDLRKQMEKHIDLGRKKWQKEL